VALWLAIRSGRPTSKADAAQFLEDHGVPGAIRRALSGVLGNLWRQAWEAGVQAAGEAHGRFASVPEQVFADTMNRYASAWVSQIASTTASRIAVAIAAGGTSADLEAAIASVLADKPHAALIAQTEIIRAMSAGALAAYAQAGVRKVRWVTEPPDPCPLCVLNEKSGPQFPGVPFPSGATAPPQHPQCRCALIPAES
jgi:Phage Mu protein F like protein